MAKAQEAKTIEVTRIKKKRLSLELVGDSPLILNKKTRSFEREEIWKQTHLKGNKIPDELNQKLHYNIWEKLITSITWLNEIPEFDNYEDYTEELYRELLETNKPCIKAKAFQGSFYETFVSFYKDATGRPGTDFKRSVKIMDWKIPVTFAESHLDQHLTPNTGINRTNVVAQHTVFEGWRCTLNASFCESIFPQKTIIDLINTAGEYIGVGTQRGEGFGSYHIESVLAI